MFKRLISLFCVLCMFNIISLPVFALDEVPETTVNDEYVVDEESEDVVNQSSVDEDVTQQKSANVDVAKQNPADEFAVKQNPNEKFVIIESEFVTELNVNKASKGQIVQFKTLEEASINGLTIPAGTIFNGKVKAFKKGRWAYRRAKVRIVLNEMVLPNGSRYKVRGATKRHVLKGSATGNVLKGVITLPIAVATGVVGAVVIIVETVSIAGLIIVGPTSYLFGQAMGKLTHGINCKKDEGDDIKLRIYSVKGLK